MNGVLRTIRAAFVGFVPVLALGLVTASLPLPALADLTDADKAEWQARYSALLDAVSEAASQYEVAKAAYSRNNSRKNAARGEARDKIRADLAEAEAALASAQAELREFPETARRAGVPPGWLREVDDAHGNSPAAGGGY